ncbi:T9SS type A sorting domain-containing protein, partial [candidate division WOR-3 bacterium]|nr:T9SS type A sorting domain-containing protein [candidate division WOR-3 bacterium]
TGVKEKVENKKNVEFSVSATSISRNNVDIKLTLGKTANVKATIYNLNGQKIKTLVSGTRESGVYNLKWNRRDSNNNRVASGIYLIRVSADNSTKTGKIVIIK